MDEQRHCAWRPKGAAVLCYDLNRDGVDETVETIEAGGGNAVAARGYVRSRDEIGAARQEALDRFGSVSFLVNNAGLVTMTRLMDLP